FVLKEFEKAKKHGFDLSFIMVDIDNFKTINDQHGHIVGDFVLKKMGYLLSQKIRPGDFLIRYGGEEFLIILSYCNVENASKRAEEIRKAIEELTLENLKITASFGVTSLSLHPEANLEELINLADQALYKAKSRGKNRVEVC
ncbi:MAG: GGDEF domain-containing protein, partial [Thermodesulfobacteriaceae bacterium]|nr:GGDEF domain-containing protein [Thermodesulfobacteriaceae bacterium]